MRKELLLEGLACSSCARKIEEGVAKIKEVKFVSINFATSTMAVEICSSADTQQVLAEIKRIVKSVESHVQVLLQEKVKEEASEHFASKKEQLRLIAGTLFFVFALITNFNFKIELGLYLISYILIGGEVVSKAIRNIFRGEVFDENFLMFIATVGAFLIQEFPEAVAVMLFYQVGEVFQEKAVNRSRKSIKALMDIRPDYANLLVNGEEKKVDPEDVLLGDIIIIKPGERVPLDGIVVEGVTMVDTAALTGESIPRKAEIGEEILSGSINKTGLIKVQVTKVFKEATVTRIIELVQNASNRKAPTESFITKFARFYTPAVVVIALVLAIIPPLVLRDAHFSDWLYRALVFLVISCPCALVVSIPLGFFGGIGGASRQGVLVKGGNYLEALNFVSTVVFDKTGTLTKGVFQVTNLNPENNFTKEDLLSFAAIAESHSQHPIAKSILDAYQGEINLALLDSYQEIPGQGVKVKYEGREILAGNIKLMKTQEIDYKVQTQVGTIVHVAVDKVYVGNILIADEIKKDALEAIENLRILGVKKLIMLTGDNKEVGEQVAQKLKLDQVYAELLPDKKVDKIEEFLKEQGKNEKLIFVGDGINDAPVLARADIGVAMGGLGSDAAIEAADVVLMTDEPSKLISAIKIAKRTKRIVWQNITFALGVKGFFLLLGAMGVATLWEAVFADVGVALIAILNAMRVMKIKT